ncbi:MAG: hypothetical protein Q4D06_05270 [Coriobacteriia bacterium]|nr:hypothetical protein [Coriobacteriia bacterium]
MKYVRPGSASSMESKIAAALCMPTTRGGCGLDPLLNEELELSDLARGFDWARTRKPDFFWPTQRVALDYDSTEWHDDLARANHDERRRNELAAMGITSLVCRAKDFRNVMGMQQLFGQVVGALGRRPTAAKNHDAKQEALFAELFGIRKWEVTKELPERQRFRTKKRVARHSPSQTTAARDD